MISTILFDLDGTLYDRDRLVRSLAEEQYRAFVSELQHIGQARYVERLIELDDHGYEPKSNVYATLVREFGLPASLKPSLESHFWDRYDAYCNLSEDTESTLKTLRQREIRLGIITNGQSERQQAKIDALGIRGLFDVVLVSEEVGIRKPDPDIFLRAIEECGAIRDATIYVGDHPQADIEGARNAGIKAVWKAVPYWKLSLTDVPRIGLLSELLTLIDIES